jgi:CBS domain-containing protein
MINVEEIMTKNPLTIDEETNVSLALSRMRDHKVAQLAVESNNKYAGMISYRDILRRRSIHLNSKIKHFVVRAPELKATDSIERALDLLRESALGALPIVEKSKIIGLVSRTDIIKNVSEFINFKGLKAFDLMNDAYSVTKEDDIETLMEKVREHDSDTVNIAEKDGKIEGLVRVDGVLDYEMKTKTRVRMGDFSGEKETVNIDIKSVMEPPVFSNEDDSILTVCDEMVKNHLHSIAVCDKRERLVGVIGTDDIINSIWTQESADGMLVNISGLGVGDTDLYSTIYSMAEKFNEKFSRVVNLKNGTLNIHVVKHHEGEEGRIKYSIRTRLIAHKINMTVDYSGWSFGKTLSEIFETYEKRSKKEFQKN